ncbi:unnamed protein product [Pleuronectes platessa]|uniref:Uncharacterized protein n=1 Tax=Pleuronectes platessa TaxID=8262 RepID=A0A9N7VWE6_PLEPL|nr:unnamed protein product [Pleuronectes platessa]
MNKAQSEVVVVMVVVVVVVVGGDFNADFIVNKLLTLLRPLSPSCLCWSSGGNQGMKQRLRRLLRPPKEEKKSKPPTSTVATVGLEEMKAKEPHDVTRTHPEGAYANTILPNHHVPHHHHTGHHGVFEDFAC